MSRQHPILKKQINLPILTKEKTELKSKKYMNLNLCSSSTRTLKEHKPRFKNKNTCPDFLAFFYHFLSNKYKNTNTNWFSERTQTQKQTQQQIFLVNQTTNANLNISKNTNPGIHLRQTQMQTQQTNTNPNMIPPTHLILQELSISDHWLKKKKSTFCCRRFKTASSDMTYWGIFFF